MAEEALRALVADLELKFELQRIEIRRDELELELLRYPRPEPLVPVEAPSKPKMADALDHLSTGQTRIEWLSSLNTEFKPTKNAFRRTSIICTIGT